mgnify:CR=1 FL=1
MPDARQISPTRSAFLELKEERQLVREGYDFLDEKRVILAQEMLRRLAAWQKARDRYDALHEQAAEVVDGRVAGEVVEEVAHVGGDVVVAGAATVGGGGGAAA